MNTELFLSRHRPLHEELIPELLNGLTEHRFRAPIGIEGSGFMSWRLWYRRRGHPR